MIFTDCKTNQDYLPRVYLGVPGLYPIRVTISAVPGFNYLKPVIAKMIEDMLTEQIVSQSSLCFPWDKLEASKRSGFVPCERTFTQYGWQSR